MSASLPSACAITLPPDFRRADLLEFHRRDPQALAEKVEDDTLRKGLAWDGRPACLTIRFTGSQAVAELAVDGPSSRRGGKPDALPVMLRRMLGLTQPVEEFAARYARHPLLAPLIARHPGLRVPVAATPFEALTWAVTGQQISVRAAISLRRRMIEAADLRHSDGLVCHPDAERFSGLSEAGLRQAGFSQSKAQTLLTLSRLVCDGRLPLDDWLTQPPPADEIGARLLEVRGIGPWTINYALLRGFGWLDGSLHGDVAVRRGLQTLLGRPDKLGEAETKQWLAEFTPWRALIAAHLWKLNSGPPPVDAE